LTKHSLTTTATPCPPPPPPIRLLTEECRGPPNPKPRVCPAAVAPRIVFLIRPFYFLFCEMPQLNLSLFTSVSSPAGHFDNASPLRTRTPPSPNFPDNVTPPALPCHAAPTSPWPPTQGQYRPNPLLTTNPAGMFAFCA